MHKNNILNNYNKNTELTPSLDSSHFNTDSQENINVKKESSALIKKLSINFNEIDFKKDIILYSTLIFFNFIAIVFGFLEKKFDIIVSIVIINYLTLFVSTKSLKIKNNRYMDISILNLCTSLNMLFKEILENKELNYEKSIRFSIILYLSSSLIAFVPSFRCLILVSFNILIFSFILALCNKDGEIIKESLTFIKNYTPVILVFSFMIGINFYQVNALNYTGFMGWIILYKLQETLNDYSFDKIEKEV